MRPRSESSATRRPPRRWTTNSGTESHWRPRRSSPSSRSQRSLKKDATWLTGSPVRAGEGVGEGRGQRGGVRPAARVVPGDDGGLLAPVRVDEDAGLGHRGEADRAHRRPGREGADGIRERAARRPRRPRPGCGRPAPRRSRASRWRRWRSRTRVPSSATALTLVTVVPRSNPRSTMLIGLSLGASSPEPRGTRRVGSDGVEDLGTGVLDATGQEVERGVRQRRRALVDDGGRRGHQLGDGVVTEDHERDVLAVQALLRAQHAEAHHRRGGEDRRGGVGRREHGERVGVGLVGGPGPGLDEARVDLDAGLGQRLLVAGVAVDEGREGGGLAEEADPPVPARDEVADRVGGALLVGDPHDVLVGDPALAVDDDDRHVVGQGLGDAALVAEGGDDEPGDATAGQALDLHPHAGLVHAGRRDEHVHPDVHGAGLDDGDDLREERVVDGVDEDADGGQLAAAEPLGRGVGVVLEQLDRRPDTRRRSRCGRSGPR